MNCLEFRRTIAALPRALDSAARSHREACPRCAEAHARALVFEGSLDRALAVPVPTQLADQILLHQITAERSQRLGRGHQLWRMAAGFTIGMGMATVGWLALAPSESLAAMAVAHLAEEPMAMASRGELSMGEVQAIFDRLNTRLPRSPGPIAYIRFCVIGGHNTAHMVMQRPSGAVTVIFAPGVVASAHSFNDAGLRGRELAVANGSLVLLSANDTEFDAIAGAFNQAFDTTVLHRSSAAI